MIDFSQINPAINITTQYILSKIDEVQIFYYYFGRFELGKNYPSKLRKDNKNSTGFYVNKNGKLIYNDFGTGEKLNCFSFVAKLHGLTFIETLKKIAQDFGLVDGNTQPIAKSILNQSIEFDKEYKRNTLIQFIPGQWTANRLRYWSEYEITKDELTTQEVYPVDKLFINKKEIYNLDELCFAYVVREKTKDGENIYIKIYCPFSDRMKWLSNVPLTIPFGLNTLKYGTDHIAIGKAQKDRMILLKFIISVIGTQNESESAITPVLSKHICHNFPRRTIIWDADETGVENCKKFNSRGFGYFNTPNELLAMGIKDVSDYVKVFGLKALEKLLKIKGII
jgi:hypothetical protein